MNNVERDVRLKLKLHHTAYATRSTDNSIEALKHIYPKIKIYRELDQSQNVYCSYLYNEIEPYMIELVEPAGKPSPVDSLLKERESALYHICYRVNDFLKGVELFKKEGYFVITKSFRPMYEKSLISCYLFNINSGIVEIVGNKSK